MVGFGVALVLNVLFSSTYGLLCWRDECNPNLPSQCGTESRNCPADEENHCFSKHSNERPFLKRDCLAQYDIVKMKLSLDKCTTSHNSLWCLCNEDNCNSLKFGKNTTEYKKWENKVNNKKDGDKKGEKGVAPLGNFPSGPLFLAALFLLPLF